MSSYAILNPYDMSYLPLIFVPLILNYPVYNHFGIFMDNECQMKTLPDLDWSQGFWNSTPVLFLLCHPNKQGSYFFTIATAWQQSWNNQ